MLTPSEIRNNKEYANGVWLDANGHAALIDVACAEARAILWPSARATFATMDDCVCRLDPAGGVCRYQSHRSSASSGLGAGDSSRRAFRIRRLVPLRVVNAGCVCGF